MPKGKTSGSETSTNDPTTAGGGTQGGPAPTPSGQTTFDLSGYRHAQDEAHETPTEAAAESGRTLGPKVKWGDLAGLDGFGAKDPFNGHHPTFGEWWATTIVAPDGKTATAISNAESGPGSAVAAAVRNGLFDDPTVIQPIHVRKVASTKNVDPKTGKPFIRVLVTIG